MRAIGSTTSCMCTMTIKAPKRTGGDSYAMKPFQAILASAAFVAIGALSHADPAPTIHYAPAENLEHIDVDLIDSAKHEIDFGAYVLTDWPVIKALTRAAERGAKVRIYLDGSQLADREPAKVFQDLVRTHGVEARKLRPHASQEL